MKTSPGKTMRFVAGLALTLIILWVMVLFQSGTGSSDVYADPDRIAEQTSRGETNSSNEIGTPESNKKAEIPVGSLLLVFIITGGGIYMYWVYKKKVSGEYGPAVTGSRLALEEKLEINPGISISVVRVNGGYWVVSCGNTGVELLKSFTREEWQAYQPDMDILKDKQAEPSHSFSGLLKNLRQNPKSGL